MATRSFALYARKSGNRMAGAYGTSGVADRRPGRCGLRIIGQRSAKPNLPGVVVIGPAGCCKFNSVSTIAMNVLTP